MLEVHLTTEEHADGCEECLHLLDELKSLAPKGARIYTMPVWALGFSSYPYRFVMASKDLFLHLGRLTQRSRDHMCRLICEALGKGSGPIIYNLPLFTEEGEMSGEHRSLLVTCSGLDSDTVYNLHLSPTN